MFERQEIENNELKAEHERELREAKKISLNLSFVGLLRVLLAVQ